MALSKTMVKTVFGKEITLQNTYHKIESVEGNKSNIRFRLQVFNENKEELVEEKFYMFFPDVSEDSVNFIKQGYEYLKMLPEYANAIDC